MDKKKITIVILALVIAVAAVLGFLFLDSIAAQGICILTAMILAAVVLALSIEKEALHALVLLAAPFVSAPFLKFFEGSELAEWIGGKYNAGAVFACQRMGMEVPGKIGNRAALVITFVLVFTVIYLIVLGLRSWIGAKQGGDSSLDKDFPEKNYQQKRKSFCKFLAKRIDAINEETNWSEETFTPIEAEVEMTDRQRRKRRYEDLHQCLRRHRWKNAVFLVLGDPGSGKSVSMRKLCAEMLEKLGKNDPIPVYVDLKKWTEDWSLERIPTEEDLITFIEKRILREGGTTYEYLFLDTYFRKMLEQGKWYFIFDSFDEMPCLMGRKSCQELIDHISRLLHTFLTRENQHGGVIASRLFRAPTDALRAAIKLTLQPFSDGKIKRMLNLYTNNSDELVRMLFGEREDLVALCRNPFYLSLLIEYSMHHGAVMPDNQMDLYEDFIESRLGRCKGRIDEMGLKNVQQVRDAARQLALYMQESTQYGLECPAAELYRQADGYEWQKVLEVLRHARICRFGGAFSTVSFVHRRFQECFFVSSIKENLVCLDPRSYSSIENNNGIRDALVLYCEIAPLDKARQIADHCWSVLQMHKAASDNIRKPGCVEVVNTLSFMAEAFRNRREAMAHFQEGFHKFTLVMLESREFVVQYAAVSSMVLFEQPQLLEMVLQVLKRKNRYLTDVVMENCRTMTRIPWEVSHKMALHLAGVEQNDFLRQFFSMDFSLSLSKQLRYVRLVHATRCIYELVDQLALKVFAPVLLAWVLMKGGVLQLLQVEYHSIRHGTVLSLCVFWAMRTLILSSQKREAFLTLLLSSLVAAFVITMSCEVLGITLVLYIPFLSVYVLYYFILNVIPYAQSLRERNMLGETMAFILLMPVLVVVVFIWTVFDEIKSGIQGANKKRFVINALITVCSVSTVIVGLSVIPKKWTLWILILFLGAVAVSSIRSILRQWFWIRKQPPVATLDRAALETNLKRKLNGVRFKKHYMEELVERKVKLTGEWPSGHRPSMRRDDLEHLLAILDCGDLENLRMEF